MLLSIQQSLLKPTFRSQLKWAHPLVRDLKVCYLFNTRDTISRTLLTNSVAFWKMGEINGAVRVDSIGSNNLADNNTVTQIAGKIGDSAHLTRTSSQSLSIADNADMSTGDIDFTFAGWVYLDSKPAGSMTILSKWIAAPGREYALQWVVADRFRWFTSTNGTDYNDVIANSFGAPSTGTWVFVVVWHDATANTINIQINNGTIDSTAETGGVFDSGTQFVFGEADGADYWDGRLDAWGFWKKVLTADEKTDIYNNGFGREHPLDIGLLAEDLSESGHDGAITGGTWATREQGTVLSLNTGNYIQIADSSAGINLGTADFSIFLRVFRDATGSDDNIFAKTATGAWESLGKQLLLQGSTDKLVFDAWGVGGLTGNTVLGVGRHDIGLTFRNSDNNMKLYVAGEEDQDGTLALTADDAAHLIKLGHPSLGSFRGDMEYFFLFDRVINSGEARMIHSYPYDIVEVALAEMGMLSQLVGLALPPPIQSRISIAQP